MAFEMSESGMSAATTSDLRVGDKVDLSPVATYRVSAIVRRKTGSIYGFEFVELTENEQKISAKCVRTFRYSAACSIYSFLLQASELYSLSENSGSSAARVHGVAAAC